MVNQHPHHLSIAAHLSSAWRIHLRAAWHIHLAISWHISLHPSASFGPSVCGSHLATYKKDCAIGAVSLLVLGFGTCFSCCVLCREGTMQMNPFCTLFPALIKIKCPCSAHIAACLSSLFYHSLWRQSSLQQTPSANLLSIRP